MENITICISIDSIASLDAQITALQAQRKKLAEDVKKYMKETEETEIVTATGHKAMLSTFTKSALSQKLLTAEFGAQFVERFKVPSEETRLTVK